MLFSIDFLHWHAYALMIGRSVGLKELWNITSQSISLGPYHFLFLLDKASSLQLFFNSVTICPTFHYVTSHMRCSFPRVHTQTPPKKKKSKKKAISS